MSFTEIISFLNTNSGGLSVLFSGIVMIATIVYAVLTASLVKETRHMRELQTEPKIEVIASPREEFVNIITLRIKNIGLGSAYNITFELSGESNSEGEAKLINDFSKSQFLTKGLKYLGPQQELQSGFTQMTEDCEAKINSRLIIKVSYENSTGKSYKQNITIYFEEFRGYGTLGKPHLYSMAQSLEKIENNINHIITGFKKLKVDTYSEEDRLNQKRENEESRLKFFNESNSTDQ